MRTGILVPAALLLALSVAPAEVETFGCDEVGLFSLTNFGRPLIYVVDGNYRGRGELLLVHRYEGLGLEMPYAQATLQNLRRIWGRPVHLETAEDGRRILLSCEVEDRVTAGVG